ncbi:MAG: hypothetical protein QXJ21_08660, partial [Thermofilum sp.]
MSFLRGRREEKEDVTRVLESLQVSLTSLEKRLASLPDLLQEPLRSALRVPLSQLQASVEEIRGSLADVVEILQQQGAVLDGLDKRLESLSGVVEILQQQGAVLDGLDKRLESLSGVVEILQQQGAALSDLQSAV